MRDAFGYSGLLTGAYFFPQDITEWQSLKGVMSNRIKEAAGKGFDFIEYDNIDCDINRCGK
jgi:hypothetical protein